MNELENAIVRAVMDDEMPILKKRVRQAIDNVDVNRIANAIEENMMDAVRDMDPCYWHDMIYDIDLTPVIGAVEKQLKEAFEPKKAKSNDLDLR